MPVQANAAFTFTAYEVVDDGITMAFVCLNPGPGQANDYSILVADTDLGLPAVPPLPANPTAQQLRDYVRAKLQRKIRAANIAARLDSFIGQSVVI